MTAAIDRQFTWDDAQETAIKRCCDMQQRIVPVTGVAGTGKTTIIREVYVALRQAGYRVALTAPTGKAAKRIQEATGLPAMTIHRLLEFTHPGERDDNGRAIMETYPRRGKGVRSYIPERGEYGSVDNLLDYEVILADEYAMVNLELHRYLIDALPAGGRICMFGDVNQLKPIEPRSRAGKESPFQAALRKFDGTELTTIHRTEEGSGIAINGDRILHGQVPTRKPDFQLKVTAQPVNQLCDIVMEALEKGINYGTNAGQIISCSKQSWVGTYKLNIALQGLLNPISDRERKKMTRHRWDEKRPIKIGLGDKVIWTENAYDLRQPWDMYEDDEMTQYVPCPAEKTIMNGESGTVVEMTPDGDIHIDVGDRIVEVPHTLTVTDRRGSLVQVDPRRSIDLGFCITTHKAQGSEWPHVIYVLNKSTSMMHCRHNMYTAVTRARETCTVITDQPSLMLSVTQKEARIERMKK